MDKPTGWCRGCYRTLSEIAAWGQASAQEQQVILQQLPQRHRIGAFEEAQLNPAVVLNSEEAQP